MACFIVPLVLGTILSILKKLVSKTAEKLKLDILATMMFGGSIVLMIEHMWHGEVVPWPPFLTAMKDPSEWAVAVSEMSTVGTAMSLAVTGTWASMLLINKFRVKMVSTTKYSKQVVKTMQ